jgi:antitoxin PrlF
MISRTDEIPTNANDPVMEAFLNFLACDMTAHPQKIAALDTDFVTRLRALIGEIEIDLEEPLSKEND